MRPWDVNGHDVIVIGASAGGVEALEQLARSLPPDLNASLFVVLHRSQGVSVLPTILSRAGKLRAVTAIDGALIEKRCIYVAPPDYHLRVVNDRIQLDRGPRENFNRPAINPLFRSAAEAYGPRVVGIILTGRLDDGVGGLWEIKKRGGVTVVQDPNDAQDPGMPRSALADVSVDHCVPLKDMPGLLQQLTSEIPSDKQTTAFAAGNEKLVELTCPECRGNLWEVKDGNLLEYRCRVGHRFSAGGMEEHHNRAQEDALWAALVALEEGAALARRFGERHPERANLWIGRAEVKERHASVLRNLLDQSMHEASDSLAS